MRLEQFYLVTPKYVKIMNISTVSPASAGGSVRNLIGDFPTSLKPKSLILKTLEQLGSLGQIALSSLCLTISILLSIRLGVLQQKENFLLHENGMSSVLRRIASISERSNAPHLIERLSSTSSSTLQEMFTIELPSL